MFFILFVSLVSSFQRSNLFFFKAIQSGDFRLNSICSSSAYQTELISASSAYPSVDKIRITHGIDASTITPKKPKIADPKVNVPTAPGSNPGDLFRTSRDVDKEFDEMINNNNYMVILYNDPVNKRAYVQKVLMEVFNWDENKAMTVMMQAHTYGLAVTGNPNPKSTYHNPSLI